MSPHVGPDASPGAGPTFDHRDAGTPEAAWVASGRLDRLPPLDLGVLGPQSRLVVLAAHPDDESLGAGGLIASAAARGARVDVVVATHGEASHPRSPTHTPGRLARRRREEVRAAVAALAPAARLRQLDLPDGALAAHGPALAGALDDVLADARGGTQGGAETWVAAPWRADGHPDHEAVGAAAAAVAAREGAHLLEFPVWAWHWADPATDALPWARLRSLALSPAARSAKAAATAAHTSQVEPLSPAEGDEPVVPAWFAEHFAREVEVFVVDAP